MQRDDWYSISRNAQNLASPEEIGDYAARRALARLGARKVKTCKVPVLFEAPLAASLIGNFVHAASGGSLYRKTSFLLDSLGQRVFSKKVQISEQPHLRGGLASSVFDSDEGSRRGRRWRFAGLFPECLHGTQAGFTDDRQCRRLPQPDRATR